MGAYPALAIRPPEDPMAIYIPSMCVLTIRAGQF